jgi:uncharacterized protein
MTDSVAPACSHSIGDRHIEKRLVHGLSVRVEVCGRCGRELVNPLDAQRVLHAPLRAGSATLSPTEVVLALLGSFPERPIINRIVLMKETFLSEKEAFPELQLNMSSLGFVPYNYGPYSRSIDRGLDQLEDEGLVTVTRASQGKKQIFSLTDEGKKASERVLRRLSPEQLEGLRKRRKGWDQLGYYGLLRKVYEEYPSYRSKSKIADQIMPARKVV